MSKRIELSQKFENFSSVKRIRSISLNDQKPQKSVELSCDKYLAKFGSDIKKITINGSVIYNKHNTPRMNTEYYTQSVFSGYEQ